MGMVGEEGGVTLDRRMLVLCCEDEGELEVGGSVLSGVPRPAGALSPTTPNRAATTGGSFP
jgi:hypothetical protein